VTLAVLITEITPLINDAASSLLLLLIVTDDY